MDVSTVASHAKRRLGRMERYVTLLFLRVCPGHILRKCAQEFVHDRLVTLLKRLCDAAFHYTKTSKPPRTTLQECDVTLAVIHEFPHALTPPLQEFMTAAVTRFVASTERGRQAKAGLTMNLGRVEHHVRRFVPAVQLRVKALVMLVAVLEFVVVDLFGEGLRGRMGRDAPVTQDVVAEAIDADPNLKRLLYF